MVFSWAERSLQPERMDIEAFSLADAAVILRNLETINAWLGGVHATLSHLRRFAQHWKPGERIRMIDWGTGGADIPRAIVRWGRQNGHPIEIVGVDSNATVLEYAREACKGYPEIRLMQVDFTRDVPSPPTPLPKSGEGRTIPLSSPLAGLPLPLAGEGTAEAIALAGGEGSTFDYALSSLCLHHLTDPQIISLLQQSDRLCRRGMIMNDLKRSVRAWLWIWALSRLTRAHPMVQDDGPLSVRRALRPKELETLARAAGLNYLNVTTHFGYRLILAGEKRRGDGGTR